MTGIVGIPPNDDRPARAEKSPGDKKSFDKKALGEKRHEVANHIAATNQPIQKVNTLFGPIVMRDQVAMAGQHARISLLVRSHLVKKLRRINLLAMIGPQVMNSSSQEGRKKARRPFTRRKKPFGSKPIFKKRPNFGDKPSPRMSGSDKPKSGASRRPAMPKKRSSRKSNASPQGGQGTLKRRR